MKSNAITIFLYATLVLAGGMIGYFTKGSLPSLIAGSTFSLALFGCAFAIYKKTVVGYFSAIVLTLVLLLFFAYRFIGSYKIMPAGVMVIVSLVVLGLMARSKPRQV